MNLQIRAIKGAVSGAKVTRLMIPGEVKRKMFSNKGEYMCEIKFNLNTD